MSRECAILDVANFFGIMKYPIGVQSFDKLRSEGFVYVDKTKLIYSLIENFQYVFLGRPRRFGKSLLMSTIQAYFEGRRDLFEGLAIDSLATDWTPHPVLHFDLNNGDYTSRDGLIDLLNMQLSRYERKYGRNPVTDAPHLRVQWLIQQAHEVTGRKVVVLIDEYDKPVLQAIGNDRLDEDMRNILKPFFGTLKSEDAHIRFAMLTGVSKFGKLSVFSDLNNIEDISLSKDYATICGLTEDEILTTFIKEIDEFAAERDVSRDRMVEDLRLKYDGYRFSNAKALVYNPFSLLNSIKNREMRDYWFESGTPTFLVKLLQHNDYDLTKIDGVMVGDESLYRVDNISAIPILYQSGYLTIKDYNDRRGLYMLGYPNREVENGFMNFLLPYYTTKVKSVESKAEIFDLIDEIESGDVEAFMTRLTSIFYSIPYSHDNSAKVQEDQVRNLTYLIFKLLGFQIQTECHMSKGRSDAVIWTADHIYVLEFKIDSSAEAALQQIIDKGYAEPYRTDSRPVTLIGINYSTADRAINQWRVSEGIWNRE